MGSRKGARAPTRPYAAARSRPRAARPRRRAEGATNARSALANEKGRPGASPERPRCQSKASGYFFFAAGAGAGATAVRGAVSSLLEKSATFCADGSAFDAWQTAQNWSSFSPFAPTFARR